MKKIQEAFSLRESAQILGVNPVTIRRLIHKKALRAGKVGRDYRISKSDLNTYYQSKGGGKLFEDSEPAETRFVKVKATQEPAEILPAPKPKARPGGKKTKKGA